MTKLSRIKIFYVGFLASILFSSPGFAQESIECLNKATGASIKFSIVSSNSGHAYYEMNEALLDSLKNQGAQVLGRGVGQLIYTGDNSFRFVEYTSYFTVIPQNTGTLLKFERYQSHGDISSETANFYFSTGECKL